MVTFIKAFCDRWDVEHNIVVPDHPIPAPAPAMDGSVEDPAAVPEPVMMELDLPEINSSMDPPTPVPSPPSVAVPPAAPDMPLMTMVPPVAPMPQAPPVIIDGDNDAIDDLNEI